MSKKSKEIKSESFEWTCTHCKSLHIEKLSFIKVEKEIVKLTCNTCGSIRPIKLINLPEEGLSNDWVSMKCHMCAERFQCFSDSNQKLFNSRSKRIEKLGFCEEYSVDSSQLRTDKRQVCHEEVTFNELFNKGIFPIEENGTL
jgi:hypothetical protein